MRSKPQPAEIREVLEAVHSARCEMIVLETFKDLVAPILLEALPLSSQTCETHSLHIKFN